MMQTVSSHMFRSTREASRRVTYNASRYPHVFAQTAKHKSAFLVDTNRVTNSILSCGVGLKYV
jgi:hypothetical protein